ncbi:hypothetical protein MHLP_01275 [Candidatus Mycoplasma haematolamae str. Purdue]|uniref:Uncharacterized protein n=1 Tax=Mycoplasma haematolamae (strain Purdue) TaxID=1212765 RepID=I7B981_MYCHA|nr:hypothetical protein [Candidatus Mycoplasma haematolamae]AFO51835.1 hypothetical protein MHLP_01275 [Candidatus Mycoplasma haematolamae str. Purdue]
MSFYKAIAGLTSLLVAGGVGGVIFDPAVEKLGLRSREEDTNQESGDSWVRDLQSGTHKFTFAKQGGSEEVLWLDCREEQIPTYSLAGGKVTIKCGLNSDGSKDLSKLVSESSNSKKINCELEGAPQAKAFSCNTESNGKYFFKKEGGAIIIE